MDRYGIQYDPLFQVACQQFIATNDTTLRAPVLSVQTPGRPDVLWIPASKETSRRILKGMGDMQVGKFAS